MKLYYSPGACSLASHITLIEAGKPFGIEKVDIGAKRTETGADFTAINPRGAVPALGLDNGEVLTEGVAIMQYVMDSAKPGTLPQLGSLERARLVEALNYISTEVHKTYSPFFRPMSDEAKAAQLQLLDARLQLVAVCGPRPVALCAPVGVARPRCRPPGRAGRAAGRRPGLIAPRRPVPARGQAAGLPGNAAGLGGCAGNLLWW
jgi:hypothetical protein